MTNLISKHLNMLIFIFLFILIWIAALLIIVAPMASEYE